ncbi:glycosyltransferase [Dyadobacter aurulentus]|uniref:glycosyltransferase n=1 Tax=Dyadobacter sp. UC 10 TaxID=2605428 RepID=UPI0011F113D4|nr:glycosyltransferase [Dyadobacter sp. UC 10]KAA0988876.1 glycosyltransferase family 4 protein [Dyadobacter sp. UC 10]
MKILTVHTFYQQKGGEDFVFDQENALLKSNVDIRSFTGQNAGGLKGAVLFFFSIWNSSVGTRFKNELRSHNPDVVHIHNLHYALGPIIIYLAKKANKKVVVTLHNFRLICPSGILLHDGSLFLDSVKSDFPWKAVFKGVYRNSVLQTFWLAFVTWFHKQMGTWDLVDKYILLTDAARNLFLESSLKINPDKLIVKPNSGPPSTVAKGPRLPHFMFVGRLTEEKGIVAMLTAFEQTGSYLKIAGTGPLENLVQDFCSRCRNISYMGSLTKEEVLSEISKCSALIFPSIWFEGMPMTIIEAFSTGTPVLASNLGAMSTMIQDGTNGMHFKPNDSGDLCKTIKRWNDLGNEEKAVISKNALDSYEALYTPEINRRKLLEIYNSF